MDLLASKAGWSVVSFYSAVTRALSFDLALRPILSNYSN